MTKGEGDLMQTKDIKELLDLYAADRDNYKRLYKSVLADNCELEKELLRKNEIIQQYEDPSREVSK